MFKRIFKFFALAVFVLTLVPQPAVSAVTKEAYLSALFDSRGIEPDYSDENNTQKPQKKLSAPAEKADAALRLGFAGTPLTGMVKVQNPPVGNLKSAVTRIEAIRFAVQSLGLSFEALTLGGVKPPFSDINNLGVFDRGCISVSQKMLPQLWKSSESKFQPNKPLEKNEMESIIRGVRAASQGLLLELDVSPAKGIALRFHREGVFSGTPKWRVSIHGFASEAEANAVASQITLAKMSVSSVNYDWSVRSELIDDWRRVEALYNFAQKTGRIVSIVPAVANTDKENVPKFWIIATIERNAFDVNMLLPPKGLWTLAPMTQMQKNGNIPLLAINGGYFTWTGRGLGQSIGTLIADGEMMNAPYLERTTVAWGRGAGPVFDNVTWNGELALETPEKVSTINHFNPKNGALFVVYTPEYSRPGKKTPKPEFAVTELILKDGVCIEKAYGDTNVKEGTVVLAGYGIKSFPLESKNVGDRIDIDFSLNPSLGENAGWRGISEAVQAGPMIVMNGRVSVMSEGFDSKFVSQRHPRTAVGVNNAGNWLFFIGDGRNGIHSAGFSLAETASILQAHGAMNVLNLDGGGSTEMLLRGSPFNWPSEGRERAVANALGVFQISTQQQPSKKPKL